MLNGPASRWQRGLVVSFGLAVLAFALPRASNDLLRLHADSSADIAAPSASVAAAFREIDLRFDDPHARIRAGLEGLRGIYALEGSDSQLDVEALKSAIADLNAGLGRAPANALAWAELAHVHLAVGDANAALAALETSLALGYYDPALSLRRTEIALLLWLILKDRDRAALRDQVRYAWDRDPERLVELASRDGWIAKTVRSLLSDDGGEPIEFDRLLNRRLQGAALAR